MTKFILMNGVRREMTVEEEAKYNQDVVDTKAARDADKLEAETKENLKASAKGKLIAGEPLTEEEANTIVL